LDFFFFSNQYLIVPYSLQVMTPSKTNMRYRNPGSHALGSSDNPIPSPEIQHVPTIP